MAEVDYLIPQQTRVYPVEVKAGTSVRAKSLQVFLNEKKTSPWGIHISVNPPGLDKSRRLLALPFYLIGQLPRILKEL